jgi:hypothetical protein
MKIVPLEALIPILVPLDYGLSSSFANKVNLILSDFSGKASSNQVSIKSLLIWK